MAVVLILYFIICGFGGHKQETGCTAKNPIFDTVAIVKPVIPLIKEASGIADSKINDGYLWVQEDSGNPPALYLLGQDGKVSKKIDIKNATNRDWEDMTIAGDEIYIADIGDNNQAYKDYSIYHFTEPPASVDIIKNAATISFRYPDGSHDAEAFLVDTQSKDIFIITKRDKSSQIYKISYPYQGTINLANLVGSLPYTGVVSAALSADGNEILIKTYLGINYYKRKTGESIVQALQSKSTNIAYTIEPQGEAICFSKTDSGFYTLSEKGFSKSVNLYFYRRK